ALWAILIAREQSYESVSRGSAVRKFYEASKVLLHATPHRLRVRGRSAVAAPARDCASARHHSEGARRGVPREQPRRRAARTVQAQGGGRTVSTRARARPRAHARAHQPRYRAL